jgi:hypothetical protein
MTTEQLDKAVELQKEFAKLYRESEIISVEPDNRIHIRAEGFFGIFKPEEITERLRKCTQYPFEYSAWYNGVRCFCITERRREL